MNIRRNFFSIVKKSYIDGQLKIHLGYNEKTRTIDSIKMIDPCMLVYNPETELYRYVQDNSQMFRQQEEITYSREEIVHSDFGLYENGIILSYLEYAIKPANMLKTLEDLIENSKKVPLSETCTIDQEEVLDLIKEILS